MVLQWEKQKSDFGKISDKTKFNFEEDGIWAFKPKPDRFLSFFTIGKKIIITNAFEKKCQKLPPAEKEKAEKCREDYEKRVKGGTYYDNIWPTDARFKIQGRILKRI